MKTILIVDDSATILMSLNDILTKAGFKVEQANNGDAALTKLKGGLKPALMITDLNMPKMNGIELIRATRALPGMRFVPILMLTTESQQAMRDEGKKAGATGWLVKPVAPEQFLGAIEKVLPRA